LPENAGVVVAAGDDCAAVRVPGAERLQLLKTDCIVEGVHFLRETDPARVGWKAVARTVSDFAAMGGRPEHLLITLVTPGDRELAWVEGLYAGMKRCALEYGATIVGGECSRGGADGAVVVSVSGTGSVAEGHLLRRSGGQPGDDLWVTGTLGGSLAGKHLDFHPRVAEGQWLAAQAGVRAAMDLSDGLAMDLPRLARASACGFTVDREALPCAEGAGVEQALGDGEDYELLLAVDVAVRESLASAWGERFPDLALTRVGRLRDGKAGELAGGWDHFR
jgi:thiamine-monophosphate kinase